MQFESARADRVTAVVFFALGAAMSVGGYTMDRLEVRNIHPASIPGLVPMILGGVLMVCAVLLYLGARDPEDGPSAEGSWLDFLVAAGWSVVFALGMVGRMPFALAAGIYLLGFTGWFLWRETPPERRPRMLMMAAVFAVVAAVAISALFRYGFLVRLP